MKKRILALIIIGILLLSGCSQEGNVNDMESGGSGEATATPEATSSPALNVIQPDADGIYRRSFVTAKTQEIRPFVEYPERTAAEPKSWGVVPALDKGSAAPGMILQVEGEEDGKYVVRATNGNTYVVEKEKVVLLDPAKDIRDVDPKDFKARPYDELFPAKNVIKFHDGSYIVQLQDIFYIETMKGMLDEDYIEVGWQEEFATFYFDKDGNYISYLPAFKYEWIYFAKKFDYNKDGVEDIFGITLPEEQMIKRSSNDGLNVEITCDEEYLAMAVYDCGSKLYVNLSVDGNFSFVPDVTGVEFEFKENPLSSYDKLVEEMYNRQQAGLHLICEKLRYDSDYPEWQGEPACEKCKRLKEAMN